MKKVVIISSSMRVGSNSEILANEFLRGVLDGGNEGELISLKNKNIAFCKGCMACQKLHKCVINDDSNAITDKICEADVVVWVSPIYYYEMSGSMKTMIDRANSLYSRERKFKEVYFLSVAADTEPSTPERALNGVKGWISCFDGVELKDYLFIGGINDANEIKASPMLEEAYEMGKNV